MALENGYHANGSSAKPSGTSREDKRGLALVDMGHCDSVSNSTQPLVARNYLLGSFPPSVGFAKTKI